MKIKSAIILISLALLTACSSNSKKTSDADLQPLVPPDASAQGLSDLDELGGSTLSEVRPYDDSYGVPGPIAEPGEPLAVRTFYFDFDSSQVKQQDHEAINAHAEYLVSNPQATISLEGHTDELGTREYNIALGEQRAKSIAKLMQLRGVLSAQIQTVSYGEEKPVAYGSGEMAQGQNRRVDIIYLR
jgi:peptidoglycan-associated lipoprotein